MWLTQQRKMNQKRRELQGKRQWGWFQEGPCHNHYLSWNDRKVKKARKTQLIGKHWPHRQTLPIPLLTGPCGKGRFALLVKLGRTIRPCSAPPSSWIEASGRWLISLCYLVRKLSGHRAPDSQTAWPGRLTVLLGLSTSYQLAETEGMLSP